MSSKSSRWMGVLLTTLTLISLLGLSFSLLTSKTVFADSSEICLHNIGSWQSAAPIPSNHMEGSLAIINGKIYIMTGFADYTTTLITSNRIDVYDPATNTWLSDDEALSSTPVNASHIQGASDGNFIWIAGGFVGNNPGVATNQVWRYDTTNDTWWRGPDLPEVQASAGLVRYGRQLHYIGGLKADRNTEVATHWVLDLDNPVAWSEKAPMPRARNHFQAVVIGNFIYAVGGQTGHDSNPVDRGWVDAYDTTTDTWTSKADIPDGRSHAEMATSVLHDRIIVAGGRANGINQGRMRRITEYDPITDTWREIGFLPEALISPLVTIIDGKMIVTAGGTDWNAPQQQTWVADISLQCGFPNATAGNYRINAGGGQFTYDGMTWNSDQYYTGGIDHYFAGEINGTDNDELYTTEHSSSNTSFSYDLPLESGSYTVKLHFAEIYWEKPNKRVFDVQIEGTTVLNNFDIVAEAGPRTAIVKSFENVMVTDGNLDIDFPVGVIDNPTVAGIEVFKTSIETSPEGTDNPSPTDSPTPTDGSVTPTDENVTPTEGSVTPTDDSITPTDENITPTDDTVTPTDEPTETPNPQPTPSVSNPGDTAVTGDLTSGLILPTFVWIPEVPGEWYHIVISQDGVIVLDYWFEATGHCVENICSFQPGTDLLPIGLLNGNYEWAVQAWSEQGGLSGYTIPAPFSVNVPPSVVPTVNTATIDVSSGRPILMLPNDPGTSWYQLWIGSQDFSTTVDWRWYPKSQASCTPTLCTLIPDAHPVNGDYVVYVQTWGAAGFNNGDPNFWTRLGEFTLNLPAPSAPIGLTQTILPNSADFSWQASQGTTWYNIWVGSTDFTETVHYAWHTALDLDCVSGICTLHLPETLPDETVSLFSSGNYTWFVQGWGPGGFSTGGDVDVWTRGADFSSE